MVMLSPTTASFTLDDASSINHVVIFLMPDTVLPAGQGATIYFQLPGKEFRLLGSVSMEKQSAVFKLKGPGAAKTGGDEMMHDEAVSGPLIIGIQLEPLESIGAQLQQMQQNMSGATTTGAGALIKPPPPPSTVADKIMKHLFNYLTSFATQNLPMGAMALGQINPQTTYVPLKAFQEWYAKFTNRIRQDPTFLDREDV
ncbi:DUF775-domain-containing protein [Saitoella complicata NRRL Y-17804]|nr:DUF775-domain-containing protein [Saitoella complicata NRRL Y-17804]ODQ52160.1 DUF775-domain-containing protein [Saitoella complicata NRRL Y-17804]